MIPNSLYLPGQLVLIPPVHIRAGFKYAETDITGAVEMISAPPVQKNTKRGMFLFELPIQLRHNIINPSVLQPEQDVGIQIIVVGLPGLCITAQAVLRQVPPYSKRTDPELAVLLYLLNGMMQHQYHRVHILSLIHISEPTRRT